MPDPFPITSMADFADDLTVVPFHPRCSMGERSGETAGHQHSAVSGSLVQHAQHVI